MQAAAPSENKIHRLDWQGWKEAIEARVTAHIQQRVSEYFFGLIKSDEVRVAVERPPHRRRFTAIFEIAIASHEGECLRRLIAKAYRITPKKGARDQDIDQKSRREFEFHRQVYDYFSEQNDRYAVVKPLDYVPELRCLIVERAPGVDLGTLIRQARYTISEYAAQKKKLGQHFQRCGEWLSLLHKGFASKESHRFKPEVIERQVNHYYNRLMRVNGSNEIADPIRQRIIGMSKYFAGEKMLQGQLHGDFKLRHIFVTGDRVIPIDFGNEMQGVAYDDIARLLVELKLLNYGLALPIRKELMSFLQQQFLLGYFGSAEWPPLLRYYYLIWFWGKWDRRLKKFATNSVIKKIDRAIGAIGLKEIVNQAYVNNWFRRELYAEIEKLQKEVG